MSASNTTLIPSLSLAGRWGREKPQAEKRIKHHRECYGKLGPHGARCRGSGGDRMRSRDRDDMAEPDRARLDVPDEPHVGIGAEKAGRHMDVEGKDGRREILAIDEGERQVV